MQCPGSKWKHVMVSGQNGLSIAKKNQALNIYNLYVCIIMPRYACPVVSRKMLLIARIAIIYICTYLALSKIDAVMMTFKFREPVHAHPYVSYLVTTHP